MWLHGFKQTTYGRENKCDWVKTVWLVVNWPDRLLGQKIEIEIFVILQCGTLQRQIYHIKLTVDWQFIIWSIECHACMNATLTI